MARPTLDEYLELCRSVPGWLHRSDAVVLAALSGLQVGLGVAADLLEIGVYHGRSAILFGHFIQAGERLFVCDPFEDQPVDAAPGRRQYGGLTRGAFEARYREHHAELPVVLACRSTELLPRELVRPPFRLVHVDGSHEPDVVAQDVATARHLLVPGGVAVFEDDHGVHVPRIPPRVRELFAAGALTPLCITPGKTYALAGPDALGLAAALEAWAAASGEVRPRRAQVAGRETLVLYPLPERAGPWTGLDRKLAEV